MSGQVRWAVQVFERRGTTLLKSARLPADDEAGAIETAREAAAMFGGAVALCLTVEATRFGRRRSS